MELMYRVDVIDSMVLVPPTMTAGITQRLQPDDQKATRLRDESAVRRMHAFLSV